MLLSIHIRIFKEGENFSEEIAYGKISLIGGNAPIYIKQL
jgi:hypothetical protein